MDPVKRLEKARREAELRTRKFHAEQRRVRREVWGNFSVVLMNTTKWNEAIDVMNSLGLWCRLKFIDVEEPTQWTCVHVPAWGWMEGPYVPWRSVEVEWMEIDPAAIVPCGSVARSAELVASLTDFNVPFTREGALVRITGHVRKVEGPHPRPLSQNWEREPKVRPVDFVETNPLSWRERVARSAG